MNDLLEETACRYVLGRLNRDERAAFEGGSSSTPMLATFVHKIEAAFDLRRGLLALPPTLDRSSAMNDLARRNRRVLRARPARAGRTHPVRTAARARPGARRPGPRLRVRLRRRGPRPAAAPALRRHVASRPASSSGSTNSKPAISKLRVSRLPPPASRASAG